MPCYHPLTAYLTAAGDVVFQEMRRHDSVRTLSLPCGRCIGCRLERSRQWALRCVHEASQHKRNSFITLTYDDFHCPSDGSLHYEHFQLFMKRLRKAMGPVRFFMCGEYGPQLLRPHYHACLFGVDFPDRDSLDYSSILSSLWPSGFSMVGDLNFNSAAYCARYCCSKVTGDLAAAHYSGRCPEFAHMSLKPGIGASWFNRFSTDVFPHDYVVANGHPSKPPRYYDKLFKRRSREVFEDVQFRRETDARARFADNSDERLRVREIVAQARLNLKRRHEAFI